MMPPTLRLVAAIAVVLTQLVLLGRGACPIAEEPASRAHAHHGTAPAPASEEPAGAPHDGSGGCYMTSACGAAVVHEAAIVAAMDDAPRAAIVAFEAVAHMLATPSPEPPPPRA